MVPYPVGDSGVRVLCDRAIMPAHNVYLTRARDTTIIETHN